jgi:hypothetical protein
MGEILLENLTDYYFNELKVSLHLKMETFKSGGMNTIEFTQFLKQEMNNTADCYNALADEIEGLEINASFGELGSIADSLQAKINNGEFPAMEGLKAQIKIAHIKRVIKINGFLDDFITDLITTGAAFGMIIHNSDYWKMRESKAVDVVAKIPLVIQKLIDEGLIEKECDSNGRYKSLGKGDREIIKWIYDYSGCTDEIRNC